MLVVKNFREERGIKGHQLVDIMRERFPKYDKHLHSKVERPQEYGIRLVSQAERLLQEAFAKTDPTAGKPDRRRLPSKVQCRMTKRKYERLQRALKRNGYDTIQAGLAYIIDRFLDQTENGGTEAGDVR